MNIPVGDVEKVEIGLATLYRGDCLAVSHIIESVDHTITDPPYEAGHHTKSRLVHTAGGLEVRAHKFDAMDDKTRSEITKRIVQISNKWALIFCQNEGISNWIEKLIEYEAKYHSTMAWIKPDAKPNFMGNGPGEGWECIVTAWCGNDNTKKTWNGGGKNGHFVIPAWDKTANLDGSNVHTSIKPQKLMAELVALFSNKDECIFDPFMGSGSTGVASVMAGRRFIGIERDPEYFEICCRRIEAAQKSDLVQTSVYVKTKAKVAVPLFEAPPKPAVKAPAAKRLAKQPKAPQQSKPRFGIPTINVDGKATQQQQRIPWANPFERYARPIIENAKGRPLEFDAWPGTRKNHLALDVECYRNFFLVCLLDLKTGARYTFERSTRTDFDGRFLRDLIENNRIVTFNGMVYDMPMVHLAIKGADNAELKAASDTIIKERLKHWEVERKLPRAKVPYGLDHIDLYEPNPAVRTGLKVLMGRMHCRFIVSLPYDPHVSLSADEMNMVTLYCFNDLDGTKALYEYLQEPLELRRVMSNEYKLDLRSKSDAQVGESVLKKRIGNVAKPDPMPTFFYKVPDFIKFDSLQMKTVLANLSGTEFRVDPYSGKSETPEWLEGLTIRFGANEYAMGIGGLHSTEANRALHSDEDNVLIDMDVSSQYPNIILKLGISPKAAGAKFQETYRAIVEERMEAKKQQQRVEEEIQELENLLKEMGK